MEKMQSMGKKMKGLHEKMKSVVLEGFRAENGCMIEQLRTYGLTPWPGRGRPAWEERPGEQVERLRLAVTRSLMRHLNLQRVAAPLFVPEDSGVQDNLNGWEEPVSFRISALEGRSFEVVHSLAKWKRMALGLWEVPCGEGLLADMRALRPQEMDLGTGIHSVLVDQWDWEQVIPPEARHVDTLVDRARKVYEALRQGEALVARAWKTPVRFPRELHVLHTQELADACPGMTPREREDWACRQWGAVLLVGIGAPLSDGIPHDRRAPDYDDYTTPGWKGLPGLNGDLLVWHGRLERAVELSSMGVRVNRETLLRQLDEQEVSGRLGLPWHQALVKGHLPQTIGGGIGQSRTLMVLLNRAHIGEVQAAAWPEGTGGPAGGGWPLVDERMGEDR